MDSRLNTKGWVAKAQYNVEDNLMLNLTYANAKRKNDALSTISASGADIGLDWDNFQLFQMDMTYKF